MAKLTNDDRRKLRRVVEWLGGGVPGKRELMKRLGYEKYNSTVTNWLSGGGWTDANHNAVLRIYRDQLALQRAADDAIEKGETAGESSEAKNAEKGEAKGETPGAVGVLDKSVTTKPSKSDQLIAHVLALAVANPDILEPAVVGGRVAGVRFKC